MENETLSAAVLSHAEENWGKRGWDSIYECWGPEEVNAELEDKGITTKAKAISHFGRLARAWASHEREVRASRGW
jgi:hypothetical protein